MTPALLPQTQIAALPGVLYEALAHPSDIENPIARRMVLASRFWSEWFAISFIWAGLCSHRYDEVNQPVLPHKCALNTISTVFHAQAKGHPMHREFKADNETSAQNAASQGAQRFVRSFHYPL